MDGGEATAVCRVTFVDGGVCVELFLLSLFIAEEKFTISKDFDLPKFWKVLPQFDWHSFTPKPRPLL